MTTGKQKTYPMEDFSYLYIPCSNEPFILLADPEDYSVVNIIRNITLVWLEFLFVPS